jgi:hypothetical protein
LLAAVVFVMLSRTFSSPAVSAARTSVRSAPTSASVFPVAINA